MNIILDLIEEYEEVINNLLMGGIKYDHGVDRSFCETLMIKSRKYHMEYGGELLEKILETYERERAGIEDAEKEKSDNLLKLMAYMDEVKNGVEEDMVMRHLITKN